MVGGLLFDQLPGIRVLGAAVGQGVKFVIQGAQAATSVSWQKVYSKVESREAYTSYSVDHVSPEPD